MRLGLYIFATLTLTAIIGAFAYTINSGNYVLELMGINFNLPVAVWFVLPMLVLLVFTILHMLFYGLKNYFKLKKWQRDAATLDDALYWALVHEPKDQKFILDEIKNSAVILSKASIDITEGVEGLNPRLTKVLGIVQKIKSGEYVDLKEQKMAKVFSEGNPLLIQNRLNRLDVDKEFVEEVMRSATSYSKLVQKKALELFAGSETFYKARKYAKVFDVTNFKKMLARINGNEGMGLSMEILNEFIEGLPLGCMDFVFIADTIKKQFTPDQNLAFFKRLQQNNPKAQNAYLYLLFEYEMLEEVDRYLDEQGEDEFIKFRALYELKQEHKNYKLEDLVEVDTICNEA
ncbi:MAG: hypothetical protein IE885_04445 [Campylobacterales bacterium]|nr:hypothetical protein [Campylobacterales bacterium]